MKRPKKSSAHGAGKGGMAGGYTSPTMQMHQHGMTRDDFLKLGGVAAAGAGAAALGASGFAHAAPPDGLVVPELVAGGGNNYNIWPSGSSDATYQHPMMDKMCTEDVYNMQWAILKVREGGFVRLKAHDKQTGEPKAFNFGTPAPGPGAGVIITRPLSLLGEGGATETIVLPDGGEATVPLTTVSGGFLPTRVNTNGQVTITGITFRDWGSAAIDVVTSDDLVIQNNYFTSPAMASLIFQNYDPEMAAILFDGGVLAGIDTPGQDDITGNFAITGNVLELEQLVTPTVPPAKCWGIWCFGTHAHGDITGNRIYNTTSGGIRTVDCSKPENQSSDYTYFISENIVKPGPVGVPFLGINPAAAVPLLINNGSRALLVYIQEWINYYKFHPDEIPDPYPKIPPYMPPLIVLFPAINRLNIDSDATYHIAGNTLEVEFEHAWGAHISDINYFAQDPYNPHKIEGHLIENNTITYTQGITYGDYGRPIYLSCGNTMVSNNTVKCENGALVRYGMYVGCTFNKRGYFNNQLIDNDLSAINLAPGQYHVQLSGGILRGTAINTIVEGTLFSGSELIVNDEDEYDPGYGHASDWLPVPGSDKAYFERNWDYGNCDPPSPYFGYITDTGIWTVPLPGPFPYLPIPKPPVVTDSGKPIVHPKNNSY